MEELPVELLQEIWLHLPPIVLFQLMTVCKHWYQVALSEGLWRRVNERYVNL